MWVIDLIGVARGHCPRGELSKWPRDSCPSGYCPQGVCPRVAVSGLVVYNTSRPMHGKLQKVPYQ